MHSGIGNPCGLGCPIRTFLDHSSFTSSPGLFAGDRVLHRLLTPRHPPCALRPDRTNRTPRPLPPKSGVPPRQPPGETRPRLCWPNQAQTTSQALVAIFATLTVLPHLDKEHGPSPHRPSPPPGCPRNGSARSEQTSVHIRMSKRPPGLGTSLVPAFGCRILASESRGPAPQVAGGV